MVVDADSRCGRLVIVILVILTVLLGIVVTRSTNFVDRYYVTDTAIDIDYCQYQEYADAILAGSPSLLMDPPQWLVDAENPYDFEFRSEMGVSTGEHYLFDYAFYDDKYYCYFGVLPVLLLYAPYKALTGTDLSSVAAMTVFVIATTLAEWGLVWAFVRRRLGERRVWVIAGSGLLMYFGSGILNLCFAPWFYHIAIICGLLFAILGVALWILASCDERPRRGLLIGGACCIALTLLARPAMVLVCLTAFPIFWNHIRGADGRPRAFFSRSGDAPANTACVIMPFLVIGAAAMWWNYVRFGSPFDFGSNYNLTGFDMTKQYSLARRGAKVVVSSAYYLFAPILPTSTFPYMHIHSPVEYPITRFGIIFEPFYGGLVEFVPSSIVLFSLFGRRMRGQAREGGQATFAYGMLVPAFLIMFVDSTVAITQRYQSDFFWLFILATISVGLLIERRLSEEGKTKSSRRFRVAAIVLVAITAVLAVLNLFGTDRYLAYVDTNPDLWEAVSSLFP